MEWERLAAQQAGALSRSQAVAAGLPESRWDRNLRRGVWRGLHPGVAATFTGPVPALTRVWGAVLVSGPGAVASHATAAWLDGWLPELPLTLEVLVPALRSPVNRPGVRVRRVRDARRLAVPPRSPPRTRTEDTVLDLVDAARTADAVVDPVLRACQHRRTTAARLVAAAAARPRLRHRAVLGEIVDDVRQGVASALERHWFRDVERPHGLPRGERNQRERRGRSSLYRDVRYRQWRLVVELDGTAAHPPESAAADRARDRRLVVIGVDTLRYGWPEVLGLPCESALECGQALLTRGWPGPLVPCGPRCAVRWARSA